MFVRVLISVDGPYAPAPISGSAVWLVSSRLGKGCYNSPFGGRGMQTGKLCQAESRRMQTKTGGMTNRGRAPSDFSLAARPRLR